MFIRDTIAALALTAEESAKIYFGNALGMLNMPAA
jgi:hypothetical protein